MLILSRKINESIVIDGRITVKIVRIDRDSVKVGIVAPPEVPVHRQEVYDEIRASNEGAVAQPTSSIPHLQPQPPPAPSDNISSKEPAAKMKRSHKPKA